MNSTEIRFIEEWGVRFANVLYWHPEMRNWLRSKVLVIYSDEGVTRGVVTVQLPNGRSVEAKRRDVDGRGAAQGGLFDEPPTFRPLGIEIVKPKARVAGAR